MLKTNIINDVAAADKNVEVVILNADVAKRDKAFLGKEYTAEELTSLRIEWETQVRYGKRIWKTVYVYGVENGKKVVAAIKMVLNSNPKIQHTLGWYSLCA